MAIVMGKTVLCVTLLVSCLPWSASAQGVGLLLNGTIYANNSIVTSTDIGTGSAALFCTTTYTPCCTRFGNPEAQWYFPNGSGIPNNPVLPYQRTRGHNPGRVILNRNSESTTTGIFRCDIPDDSGVTQSLYVGIYNSTTGGPSIQGDIQFQLTSALDAATPVFTLTCTSTGGPATIVSWQRDGVVVPGGTTELTDPVTATYTSTLNATGRETASYCCVVANSRSSVTSQMLLLQAAGSPSNIHARRVGSSDFIVSWTTPTSGATVTGYRVYYNGGTDQGSKPALADGTAVAIANRTWGLTYSIEIVALSSHLPSPVVEGGVVTLDVGIFLNGVTYADSIVNIMDIGTGSAGLLCRTTYRPCCSAANPEAQWYFPNGSRVPNPVEKMISPEVLPYYSTRSPSGTVSLNRNPEGTTTGIFRCDIPGANETIQSLYVGIDRSHTGVGILLNGVIYTNNSIVNITDVETGSAALFCTTKYSRCCSSANPETQWYFPNGSQVLNPGVSGNLSYSRTRNNPKFPEASVPFRSVLLHHNPEDTTTGIFYCDIPDASGVTQRLYVGIYSSTTAVVRVKVVNATALLVSWDALFRDTHHYTIYYSAFSPELFKVVDESKFVVPSMKTFDIVLIRELTAGVEHQFQVTSSVEVQGRIYERKISFLTANSKIVFDEAAFHLQMGPVSPCTTWSTERAEEIRSYVHSGIAKAISYQCNCSFPVEFIRKGLFRCWKAPDEFAYRSAIVGTETHNSTELVQFLEEWVNSEPTLQVDQFELWVDTQCPVLIPSLKLKGEGRCS